MAKFKITTEDGTYEITADNEGDAVAALGQMQAQNYTGPSDKNGVPEGMVFDPATNRMVDARALAEQQTPNGSIAGAWMKGMPFIGEYADELAGYLTSSSDTENQPNASQPVQTEVARQSQKIAEEKFPVTATAGKIVTGLTTVPAAVAVAPASAANLGLGARTLLGGAAGLTGGAAEGFVSGYGEGKGDDRMDAAKNRAIVSGATGLVLGTAAPAVSDVIGKTVNRIKDWRTVDKNLDQLGISRPAADTMSKVMQADDALGQPGLDRIVRAGDDAMLADAGDSAATLLDTTIQNSGKAGNIARKAVDSRLDATNGKLRQVMDLVLGKPPGINKAAKDISDKTAALRDYAYQRAYSKPIDYASEAGRGIEGVFQRTPPSILRSAISEANDAMIAEGRKNMQILADIADDGTITFRQMPNIEQVDQLKRALNAVADQNVDEFGRLTGAGLRAEKLARELRDAARLAVPEYGAALRIAGDKISEDKALRLGRNLLQDHLTREQVKDSVEGMTEAETKQLALGLRQHIDDTMAKVKQAVNSDGTDAKEVTNLLKDFSSKAAREKVTLALGEQRANALFKELGKAQAAANLKNSVAVNSKTFARTEATKMIKERGKDTVMGAVKEGRPLETPRRLWQSFTGATPEAKQAADEKTFEDISKLLTGPRGQDALNSLQSLLDAYKTGQLNAASSRQIGKLAAGGIVLPAYQQVNQLLSSQK